MLTLHHFDTATRLALEGSEIIAHCLASYLFPEARFSVGHIDRDTATPDDLRPYQGQSLQFSSGERMYFSDQPVGELLYPTPSDRAAYGSLTFTPCKSFHELLGVRVLVIDDGTGDSGGVLGEREFAKALVGDCYGKMSLSLAEQLTARGDTPLQFRLGIRPQEGCGHYRIAKGTLAPDARCERPGGSIEVAADLALTRHLNLGAYDLVLATSMFKGRKGAEAIQPGSYVLDLGLGVKVEAEYGRQRLGTQVLVNYPRGVAEDILPALAVKARELKEALGSPHALAREFIACYEEKQQHRREREAELELFGSTFDALFDAADGAEGMSREEALYGILKADLAHYGQLLEHPFVIEELKAFAQHRWAELAYSGGVKFHSALAQPCAALGEDEVCAPTMPDGAALIVTRSPLVNSNGVITLTNRHLPELMRLQGCIHLNPAAAAKHLQADFDGDRLAFEQADRYPALAAEIRERLLPENRYPDVVKRDKVPYRGSFAEIAIACARNDVGAIANQISRAASLYHDTAGRPAELLPAYLNQVTRYYADLVRDMEQGKLDLPPQYHEPVRELACLATKRTLSPTESQQALALVRQIQRQIICDLSNELQVAVDGPKSAARPDLALVEACKRAGNCLPVSFISEKKDGATYRDRPAAPSTYCPVGAMARLVSQHFEQTRITARPIHLFRGLFPDQPAEVREVAREIKEAYQEQISTAASLRDALARDPERGCPHLLLQHRGKSLAVTRIDAFRTREWLGEGRQLDVEVISRPPGIPDEIPNRLFARALINGEPRILGAISLADERELGIKAGTTLESAVLLLCPAITESRIEASWRSLRGYTAMVRHEHPPEGRYRLAAALWQAAHTKDSYGTKRSIIAFNLFPDEALRRLAALQFRELQVIGLQYPTNQHRGRQFGSEPLIAEVVEQPVPAKDGTITLKRGIAVEGQFLAPLQQESHSYAVGTFFKATIALDPPTSATATLTSGAPLEIRRLHQYAHAGTQFEGTPASLTVSASRDGLLVSLDGAPLGLVTSEGSASLRRQYGARLLRGEAISLEALLTSAPSNAAILCVDPHSLRTPWHLEVRHLGEERQSDRTRELAREGLQEQYLQYLDRASTSNPNLSEGFELDVAIAGAAEADGRTFQEVAAILSTSDTLLQVRPEPHSPTWDEYEEQAKQYVVAAIQASGERCGGRESNPTKPEPLPADRWHGTYLAYTERVRLANPLLQDPAELGKQVATLIRADGRSPDEERQILRAGRVAVVR